MDGSFAHIIAGGVAGTAGALFTSPLEIVKTRLQGSVNSWGSRPALIHTTTHWSNSSTEWQWSKRITIGNCIRHIYRVEGVNGLFKGLTMTLAGVLPSRAIYFGAYFNGQELFHSFYPKGSHSNVFAASAFASFVSATVTNPIWYVKTRMQLDESRSTIGVFKCITETWRRDGISAFFKGIQASYIGIAETSLQFVLYEHMKQQMLRWAHGGKHGGISKADDMIYCSIASATSKAISTVACYPHEVLRTRLRQEGNKYNGLSQSVRLIVREEGVSALYKGMLTHFVRQIPNTCIVLTVYEGLVHLMCKPDFSLF